MLEKILFLFPFLSFFFVIDLCSLVSIFALSFCTKKGVDCLWSFFFGCKMAQDESCVSFSEPSLDFGLAVIISVVFFFFF